MDDGFSNAGDSSASVRPTVTCAREARKQAELDAQLLANRIALLKQEEGKALKKIEETRKKANEVKVRQQAKLERERKKEVHLQAKELEIQRNLERNSAMREGNRATREACQSSLIAKKRDMVQKGRMQSEMNLNEKLEREMNEQEINRRKWEEVNKSKEDAKTRNAAMRACKYDGHRENYANKIAREDEMKAQTEALIQRMEREEMELIQRLQNTYSVQQSAMADLEDTIASSTMGPRGAASSSKSQDWSSQEGFILNEEAALRPNPAA